MGFRLETVKGKDTPYDDRITLTGMDRLLQAAAHAGVDLETKRIRTKRGDERVSGRASLSEAFSVNYGWLVNAKEAADLAKKLGKVAWASDDPQFIEEMSKYFAHAAKKGGLYVW